MNLVILHGRLGADPELRYTNSGEPVLNMRLATTETWFDKAKNQKMESTDWHSLVMWGKRAESIAPHLSKGAQLVVTGKLKTSSYEKGGEKRYKTEVRIDEIEFAGGGERKGEPRPRPVEAAPQRPAQATRPQPAQPVDQHEAPNEFGEYGNGPDDIPF